MPLASKVGDTASLATGQPVAGALVVPRPHRPDQAIISTQTSTRNDGTFDLRLPPSIDRTDLAILGRGFELSLVQLGLREREEGIEISLHPSRETTVTIPLETHLTMADLVESGGAFPILRDASGSSYDSTLLRQWARIQGESSRGGELRVRGLRPEIYTLCWLDAGAALTAGSARAAQRLEQDCQTSMLAPYSEISFVAASGLEKAGSTPTPTDG